MKQRIFTKEEKLENLSLEMNEGGQRAYREVLRELYQKLKREENSESDTTSSELRLARLLRELRQIPQGRPHNSSTGYCSEMKVPA